MEKIFEGFQIRFLLRSFFSGVFFVLSYFITLKGSKNLEQVVSANNNSALLVFALTSGVVVYGIHRAFLFPLIEFILDSKKAIDMRKKPYWRLIRKQTVENLWERAERKKTSEKPNNESAASLEILADYIHLQYSSALCLFLGSVAAIVISENYSRSLNVPVVSLFFLLFCSAFISHWRSHSTAEYLKKLQMDATNPFIKESCNPKL